MSVESESPNPEQVHRQQSMPEITAAPAERPKVLNQEPVLTPDRVGDIRQFAESAADWWQNDRKSAIAEKDIEASDHARDMQSAMLGIKQGEAISPPEGPLNLEAYRALGRAYMREHPHFEEAAYDAEAFHGISPRLVEMELTDLATDTFADRALLHGATKEGTVVRGEADIQDARNWAETAKDNVQRDLQLKAELEHLQKGGDIADAPLAAERLQMRIDEARQRRKEADVRAARGQVEQAHATSTESRSSAEVEKPTDDASRAEFADEHFGHLEPDKILDPDTIDKYSIYTDSVLDVMTEKHSRAPNLESIRYPETVAGVLGNGSGPEVTYLVNAINLRLGERKFADPAEIGSMSFAEVLKQYLGLDVLQSHPDYFKVFRATET